jgi:hypothetical protein
MKCPSNVPPARATPIERRVSVVSLLTCAEVIATLGPLDDVMISEIIGMHATSEELAEARAWVANDEALMNAGKHIAEGPVGRLVEILSSIEEEADLSRLKKAQ